MAQPVSPPVILAEPLMDFLRNKYRVAPPLVLLPNQYEGVFNRAFERIKTHQAYPPFLHHNTDRIHDDQSASEYFKKGLSSGTCAAQIIVLSKISSRDSSPLSIEHLKIADIEEIFYYQILVNVNAEFEMRLRFHNDTLSEAHAVKLLAYQQYPAIAPAAIKELEPINQSVRDELLRSHSTTSEFNIELPVEALDEMLEALIKKSSLPPKTPIYGRITIDNIINERALGQIGTRFDHEMFFYYSENCYRFYDPMEDFGLFAFGDRKAFFSALQIRLLRFESHVKFYFEILNSKRQRA
jgi:hypothetical protein